MSDWGTCLMASALACSLMTLGAASLPADAQPQEASRPGPGVAAPDQQNPSYVAIDLNMRRSTLYQQKNTAGVASLYTADATYTELMPVLQVLKGRDQIKGHLDDLIDASAVTIVPTVLRAERNADGTIAVSGDYLVMSGQDERTAGHFIQTLRQEDGVWRIASHVFARPNPLTATEADLYPRD